MTVEEVIAQAMAHDKEGREREAASYYDQAYAMGVPEPIRKRFLVGYGSTLRNVGRADDAVGVLSQSESDYPAYPALRAILSRALLDAGHPKAAVAAMLGVALDVAKDNVFEGYERALSEYHQLLLADVAPE
jgi:predicted Zn-dependent protease